MSPAVVAGVAVGVLVVALTVWALADLASRDVEYLPKWAWAACIVLLSIVGVGAYALLGRVPADGDRPVAARLLGQEDEQTSPDRGHELMLIGMVLGLVIGTALGQIALGMAVGLALGAVADALRSHRTG